jgi:hypothetical protein
VPADAVISSDRTPDDGRVAYTHLMQKLMTAARFGQTLEWLDALPPYTAALYMQADAEMRRREERLWRSAHGSTARG